VSGSWDHRRVPYSQLLSGTPLHEGTLLGGAEEHRVVQPVEADLLGLLGVVGGRYDRSGLPAAGHQAFLHDPFGNLVELNQPE
jgi:hypothetical protein